jgi:hypothetical protein
MAQNEPHLSWFDFSLESESSSQDGSYVPSDSTRRDYRRYGDRFEQELQRSQAGLDDERSRHNNPVPTGGQGNGGRGGNRNGPSDPSDSPIPSSRSSWTSRSRFPNAGAPSLFSRIDQPDPGRLESDSGIPWLAEAVASTGANPHQRQLEAQFRKFKQLSKVLRTSPQKPPHLLPKHWDALLKDEYVDLSEVFANFTDPLPALQTVAHLSSNTSIVSGATPATRLITNLGDWQTAWNIFEKAYLWIWRNDAEAVAAYAENFRGKLGRAPISSWSDAIGTEARFRLRLASDRRLSFRSLVEFNDQFFTDVILGIASRRPDASGSRQLAAESSRPPKRKASSMDEPCERFNKGVAHAPCGRPHVCAGGCGGANPRPQCTKCRKRPAGSP